MRKWDLQVAATKKEMLAVTEDEALALYREGEFSLSDRMRPAGTEKWLRAVKILPQIERLARAEQPTEEFNEAPQDEWDESYDAGKAAVTGADDDDEDEAGSLIVRRRLEVDEYDLTPMVDMTFLLNMFFIMTTAYALLHSMSLPPPSPEATSKAPAAISEFADDMPILAIAADNRVMLNDKEVSLENLAEVLGDSIRQTDKREILITADDAAYTETLVKVIDAANASGMQRIVWGIGEPNE